MAATTVKFFLPGILLVLGEQYFLRSAYPAFYTSSSILPYIPRLYGLVLLVNAVGSAFTMVYLGFSVNSARRRCKDKAIKDGDTDAEARFSYPKLYAEGFSKAAHDFNCAQRGHQHALETYAAFVVLSLAAGIYFPFLSSMGGLLWIIARIKYAEGYSTGEVSSRYRSFWSAGIWSSLVIQTMGAIGTIWMISK
jgi:glutathione S-transferase